MNLSIPSPLQMFTSLEVGPYTGSLSICSNLFCPTMNVPITGTSDITSSHLDHVLASINQIIILRCFTWSLSQNFSFILMIPTFTNFLPILIYKYCGILTEFITYTMHIMELTFTSTWVLSFLTRERSQMQAACLTCGLGLIICLLKITSKTQGTTSFTLAPEEKAKNDYD